MLLLARVEALLLASLELLWLLLLLLLLLLISEEVPGNSKEEVGDTLFVKIKHKTKINEKLIGPITKYF